MLVPSPVGSPEMGNWMGRHHQGLEFEHTQAGHLWLSWVRISDIKQVTESESQRCRYLHLSLMGQVELVTGLEGQVCCSMTRWHVFVRALLLGIWRPATLWCGVEWWCEKGKGSVAPVVLRLTCQISVVLFLSHEWHSFPNLTLEDSKGWKECEATGLSLWLQQASRPWCLAFQECAHIPGQNGHLIPNLALSLGGGQAEQGRKRRHPLACITLRTPLCVSLFPLRPAFSPQHAQPLIVTINHSELCRTS